MLNNSSNHLSVQSGVHSFAKLFGLFAELN